MVFFYAVLAALITAATNLLIRRGLDAVRGVQGDPFIIHRFISAGLVMSLAIYLRHGQIPLDSNMLIVGAASGLILGLLQYTLGRSLQYGPPALSFILVSSACVIPPIMMFFVFGEEFGHGYTFTNLIGSLLVLAGLVWMAKSQGIRAMSNYKVWLFWAVAAFLCGIFYQTSFQWRALLLKDDLPASPLLPFHCTEAAGDCFLISMFFVGALFQKLLPNNASKASFPPKQVLICGILGGIMNGLSGFILMKATELAVTDIEKAIIYPLFTVLLISSCNAWAKAFYNEKVNWLANGVCMAGIVVGSR